MYTSNYKKTYPASPLFLCFQLAEELIHQGWSDEVKELVALFSQPHFKVKPIPFLVVCSFSFKLVCVSPAKSFVQSNNIMSTTGAHCRKI